MSFLPRKQIGIVNTCLASSSTVRDLPVPELCTIGRVLSLDSLLSSNALIVERSSIWFDPTNLVCQAFSVADKEYKDRIQRK